VTLAEFGLMVTTAGSVGMLAAALLLEFLRGRR
jgi:hypothetical protein